MDIHTGGADLKFPHHDNEIAQAEVCISAPTPRHMATTSSSHGNDLLSHGNDLLSHDTFYSCIFMSIYVAGSIITSN